MSKPKLESVVDFDDRAATARRIYDLQERISELELTVAERIERERVLTLELAAARRDLEVKSAYNMMLESAAVERQQTVGWLQARVEQTDRDYANIAAEVTLRTQQAEAAAAQAEALRGELAAERARLSYRAAQRLVSRVGHHPRLTRTARRVYRAARRDTPPSR